MGCGVAPRRGPLHPGAPGIPEPQERRRLVEGFAGGVVDRAAETLQMERRMDMKEGGVTAAGNKADTGVRHPVAMRHAAGVEMGGDVVVADEGASQHRRDPLRCRQADQERADESRLDRHRHCLEPLPPHAGSGDGLVDHRHDPLDMRSRRHLRHDATPAGVELVLAGDDARQHPPRPVDDGRRRLVAGRLDRQQGHSAALRGGRKGWREATSIVVPHPDTGPVLVLVDELILGIGAVEIFQSDPVELLAPSPAPGPSGLDADVAPPVKLLP